jgi:hypothetical protein
MLRTMATGLALALITNLAAAQAVETSSSTNLRPFIGIGFTSGGDTIIPVNVTTTGSTTQYHEDISAGGGLDLRLGLSKKLGELPLTVQLVAAYHIDQTAGVEGSKYSFRRYPIEATLLWHATERGRIGFGVRKALNPQIRIQNGHYTDSNGNEVGGIYESYDMKSSVGWILEGEYAVTPSWSLKARYVMESFRYVDYPEAEKYNANHLGIESVWYMN